MSIDMTAVAVIKDKVNEGRGATTFKPVSLSLVLRERFQEAADQEMGGDFSHMLEVVLRLYLDDPKNFPVCWISQNEGSAKNKPLTLSTVLVEDVQEEANRITDGVFARLVQIIIRGYLLDRKYIIHS